MRVLAGDLGATHARLALFEAGASEPEWTRVEDSARFACFEDVVRAALDATGARPEAATFGVPGPVHDGHCRTTNLPWHIDARELSRATGIPRVALLNDVEASAWGLSRVAPSSLVTLHAGAADARGNRALIASGTGLGEAGLAWDGTRHVPFACEGGHADFAPRDEEQDALLVYLRARLGHVSWERVACGIGLINIAEFLDATGRAPMSSALRDRLARGDGGRAVTEAAESGEPAAQHALRLMTSALAAEAGNLALKLMATGGVFIAGGIPPRIRTHLQAPEFIAAFLDKGRLRPVLETMPVMLVLDDALALRGAAAHASGVGSDRPGRAGGAT